MRARADKDHLKSLMVELYRDREKTRQMGIRASQTIRSAHSWEAVTGKLLRLAAGAMT